MWLAKKEKVTSGIVIGWNQIHIRSSSQDLDIHELKNAYTCHAMILYIYNNICIIVLDNKEFDN